MTLRITWRYVVAFAALTMLCGTSHEFAHHFAGAALCGGFGTKTFNSFTLAAGCDASVVKRYWAALAGPVFTFGLMWAGYVMLRSKSEPRRMMGFALVFANFPVNRMLFVLLGQNDEQYAGRLMFGRHPLVFWLTVVVVWGVCLPPLVEAFQQLRNQPRIAWFAAFFLLPFCFVVVFAGVLEEFVLLRHPVMATGVLGIPYLILLVEALSVVTFEVEKKWLTVGPAVEMRAIGR
ncbi:MAG: hypothetical protein V4555_02950 [Acidobacteriota bacterium]